MSANPSRRETTVSKTGTSNTTAIIASVCCNHTFLRHDLRGSTKHIMRERGSCTVCGLPIVRTYDFRTREEEWIFLDRTKEPSNG